MREESIQFFTDKEEEFVSLLIDIGLKKNIAKSLVFLANTSDATSREIERGSDLRQSEVSIAMRYLMDLGWIKVRESPSVKGRPHKSYSLAVPFKDIIVDIEKTKKNEANNQLVLLQKIRDY